MSWAGICPGNHQTGGKRMKGTTRKRNRRLWLTLCEAAWAAKNKKGSYLRSAVSRSVPRRGHQRAIVAVAHSLLTTVYYFLREQGEYREMGQLPRSSAEGKSHEELRQTARKARISSYAPTSCLGAKLFSREPRPSGSRLLDSGKSLFGSGYARSGSESFFYRAPASSIIVSKVPFVCHQNKSYNP